MENSIASSLHDISTSLGLFTPEIILAVGTMLLLVLGLFTRDVHKVSATALLVLLATAITQFLRNETLQESQGLFSSMIAVSHFSSYFGFLLDVGGILTILMSWPYFLQADNFTESMRQRKRFISEYYLLIVVIILGGHLLVSSINLLMVFLSLELMSIPSYALAGFLFEKRSAEGSLKYFVFGSVASAVMLYGFSLYYGFFETLDIAVFSIEGYQFSPLILLCVVFSLAGFLYKVAAVPMHPWAPDVYEAAPTPIVAFFSIVPKLAGIAILTKFVMFFPRPKDSGLDFRLIISLVAILTILVGNFSALVQKSPKRMMAYSSIAQSGFLLVGVVGIFSVPQTGLRFLIFYSAVYLIMNFLVFFYLQYFEHRGFTSIASYKNAGFKYLWPSIFLLIGFISLTGLPPTAGFTAKLFIFSSLWEAYSTTQDQILLWLLIFGLLNTVVSLFYYLRIPYFAFIKNWDSSSKTNILEPSELTHTTFFDRTAVGNLLGLILVIVLLLIFFAPGLLMGWINKINFVL